ncbi:DUF323 domain-containing protein [Nannizzia gypsea CBS 118893]|uniref:4-dimethylallyltryptophan N-methyltransferase n=1 Tax=Arthroderma gypseum (strain ATCC MYA-4604 / CBS 118893) TaxID=535722 RepID=E4V5S6_ARTGP|nr:DUF323 domain-containing protein [Nannizzia gypsea CBS 118893]EFR05451.1 DUF323 domain-containing protein [Nannizzia gypsea CBS 118893]
MPSFFPLKDTRTIMCEAGTVIDIGGGRLERSLKELTEYQFLGSNDGNPRDLPTGLFYNTRGLQIWGDITRLPEYRQTQDEIDLLNLFKGQVADWIVEGCTIIDMGSGDTRKVLPLLEHLEQLRVEVQYFALDLSKQALEKTMKQLVPEFHYVRCFGLWGAFSDGLNWLRAVKSPKLILSLGSMFGNDEFSLAVSRLEEWKQVMGPGDLMLLGLDACQYLPELWNSYHDPDRVWDSFIKNGLEYSNEVLGCEWYREEDWEISGRIDRSPDTVHRFSIIARRDVHCHPLGMHFSAGERVDFFEAWKYGPERMRSQFKLAGFDEVERWQAPGSRPFCT